MPEIRKHLTVSILVLILTLSASALYADQEIYLYSEEVLGLVDTDLYSADGAIVFLEGKGSDQTIELGPAPPPYPQIHVWEEGIERVGETNVRMDGMRFVNHGTHWVKGRLAIVEWTIEIPAAAVRLASEFEENMTVTLWVDWNRDEMWAPDEAVMRKDLNVHQFMPTEEGIVRIRYLTKFKVPDADDLLNAAVKGDNERDVYKLWVRGVLSYDDPDVSPDGEQLFGDVEDYRVRYMKTPRPREKM